jgi:hypothetical protein
MSFICAIAATSHDEHAAKFRHNKISLDMPLADDYTYLTALDEVHGSHTAGCSANFDVCSITK